MAATPLTNATTIVRSGSQPATQNSDTTNGNSLLLNGFDFLQIKNTDASPHTVTFVRQSLNPSSGLANPNISVAIAAGATVMFGPFDKLNWADANGNLQITYSAGTGTTLQLQWGQLNVSNPPSLNEGSI